VIPYLFSAAAQLYWLLVRGRDSIAGRRLARDITVSVLAMVFSYWAIQGSGYQTVYYGLFVLLLGLPVYIWLKRAQGVYGEEPTPQPVAEGRAPETVTPPVKRLSRGLPTTRTGGIRRNLLRHRD
jgi:APA family basic amino acid/polyamine antiporter